MKDLILCCSVDSLAQAQSSCNMILNVNCIICTNFAFLMEGNLKKINLGFIKAHIQFLSLWVGDNCIFMGSFDTHTEPRKAN